MNQTAEKDQKRCGSCAHWASRSDFLNLWAGEGADREYRRCGIVPLADSYEDAPDPLPLAVAKDGSDYKADLFTLADFGCVQWEPHLSPPNQDGGS